jgi:hypothetical protein
MAPVPEGRLLLTARRELAAADPAAAGPALEQGFGAPPSRTGGPPASGGVLPSADHTSAHVSTTNVARDCWWVCQVAACGTTDCEQSLQL